MAAIVRCLALLPADLLTEVCGFFISGFSPTTWVLAVMDAPHTTSNNLLTDKQAAPLLGVEPATLRSWRCRGIGPVYVKLGLGPKAACRYPRHDIEAFIAQCRQVPCVRAAWESHGDL
jgi:hypothetical protein